MTEQPRRMAGANGGITPLRWLIEEEQRQP